MQRDLPAPLRACENARWRDLVLLSSPVTMPATVTLDGSHERSVEDLARQP
jgi:hypothetical protein